MPTTQPAKIIGYGLVVQRTGVHTGPFLCMDSECKDTYEDVMREASFLDKHEQLRGIFAIDTKGNFSTIHNADDIDDAVEGWRRGQLTDVERRGEDADTAADHNRHSGRDSAA